ncbi:hypothetical protein NDU88_010523 [Pleurodeles waltl]|uniref:Uncharacterized protein n=1 Tax=Pleurodeles waltl TaxID=8319 RepID=A0AAV7PVU1_PLEWA|nr:hypothetical protein NDU88_010523 [Pleurodeles waltl]
MRLAADAPEERCGGMGFVPAGTAASWEQRPGPSGVHRVVSMQRTAGDKTGECLEEGELVDDGEEDIWWEQGGVGPANVLSQSLQGAQQVQPVSVGKALYGAQMVRRKAQERPPSLTSGEEGSSVTMVSVGVEVTEAGDGRGTFVEGGLRRGRGRRHGGDLNAGAR